MTCCPIHIIQSKKAGLLHQTAHRSEFSVETGFFGIQAILCYMLYVTMTIELCRFCFWRQDILHVTEVVMEDIELPNEKGMERMMIVVVAFPSNVLGDFW